MTWTYRTSQPAKVDGQAAQEMSGQDKVAAAAQPQTKEDQEANYSAEIAEGQQEKQGQHKYEDVSLVCADAILRLLCIKRPSAECYCVLLLLFLQDQAAAAC